jgi:hypothetical protein
MVDDFIEWVCKAMLVLCCLGLIGLFAWVGYGMVTGFDSLRSTKTCTVTITIDNNDGTNVIEKVESCSYGDK